METTKLNIKLEHLEQKRPICVIGAAIIDIITHVSHLPTSGDDVLMSEQQFNIGGCALNIAIALQRLNLSSLNALPLGSGIWSNMIKYKLKENNIDSALPSQKGDNGWCLALVEPNGERTFLTTSGAENNWNRAMLNTLPIKENNLIYLSGYQLAANSGSDIISWLQSLYSTHKEITLLIDFGPRLAHIDKKIMDQLIEFRPIISLNREEASMLLNRKVDSLNRDQIEEILSIGYQKFKSPLVVRVDKDGAYYANHLGTGWIKPFEANVIDSIGAGDSHAAGLLAGLSMEWTLSESVQLGNAMGSYVVSHQGGDSAPSIEALKNYLVNY